jgi:hypothetical protein
MSTQNQIEFVDLGEVTKSTQGMVHGPLFDTTTVPPFVFRIFA